MSQPQDIGGVRALPPPLGSDGLPFSPNGDRKFEHWEVEVSAIITVVRRKHPEVAPTWDVMRRHIESLPPAVYAASLYYEKWALGFFLALFESPLPVSRADLARKLGVRPGPQSAGGTGDGLGSSTSAGFSPGDIVEVCGEDRATQWLRPHLRTPGYIHGKRGVVERRCGAFPSPELLAFGIEGSAEMLYRVRFVQRELWPGYEGAAGDTIDVEVYEPWLVAGPRFEGRGADSNDGQGHRHDDGEASEHDANASCDSAPGFEAPVAAHAHGHAHDARAEMEQAAVNRERPAGPYRRVVEALKLVLCDAALLSLAEIQAEILAQDMNETSCKAGASLVVRAWTDEAFRARLLADGRRAVKEHLGLDLDCGQLIVVENGPALHNLVVCTLCSCYPTALLGKPPDWYKSRAYRARAVFEPRKVLAEFGLTLAAGTTLRVHDSTADMRYLVLPALPLEASATDDAAVLLRWVTRDAMVGVGVAACAPRP